MTRVEYLQALEKELRGLPQKDFQEAMDYFTEYLEDAGLEHEADIIAELGTPSEAAKDIVSTVLGKTTEPVQKRRLLSLKTIGDKVVFGLLFLLASPFLVALALVVLALGVAVLGGFFTLAILVGLIPITGILFAGVTIVTGFVTLAEAVTLFANHWTSMVMGVGGFLAAVGCGLCLFAVSTWLGRYYLWSLGRIAKWVISLWHQRKWRNRHEN